MTVTSIAGLAALSGFARAVPRLSWFAACGEPLLEPERADAEAFLAALGLPPAPIEGVPDWSAAAATTKRPDWSAAWWDAEEAARIALHRRLAAALGEAALLAALTAVAEAANDAVHGAAAVAAARAGTADPALIRVAAGAAAQACHQNALALAAGEAAHPFALKFRLFAAGRWPLGIVGGTCFVF
jgi:hypothetical protein